VIIFLKLVKENFLCGGGENGDVIKSEEGRETKNVDM
jgi:hypothetical protein